ncbi:MAG TPA: acyl-ACP--UDP-N-acetylglucosamine O-acyltransferase [Thermodesulfobacteriota bacterium]|nr:acyl-ACP--UDP-N-acetylglucosamine O-acyltransferase [Thermodesulfobacteriota bacterium]
MIHPSAIVDPKAELGRDVEIGPYAIVGPGVVVGDGTVLMAHAVVERFTRIGRGCRIHPFAVLGGAPQDLKYKGEETWLEVGDETVVREAATLNRGTAGGRGRTVVGRRCLLMAYSHVAHDCVVGDQVVLANAATLAGHVTVEEHAILGGLAAVQQFVRIGAHAFVGGTSGVNQDVPPYCLVSGSPAALHGLNLVGLKRRGFPEETIRALKRAYQTIFRNGLTLARALEQVRAELGAVPEVRRLADFIEASTIGVCR